MEAISQQKFSVPNVVVEWKLPPNGYIKIIWDIAIKRQSNKIGIDINIYTLRLGRSSANESDVISGLLFRCNYAEARGLFEAVKLGKELGLLEYCMFEGDSSQVVNDVLQQNGEDDSYNPLIANIKQLLQETDLMLKQVKRDANRIAHGLASPGDCIVGC